ncbi:MAG: Plug domain-containing protein, partial [Bacteroidetes bacterium]|nr:Plug domain-containing protein [Bacteroidota bacterium]
MFDNGIKNQPVKSALAVILFILSLAAMGQVKTERLARKDNVMPRILDSATIAVMKQSVDRNLISQTLLKANPSQNFAELLQKQSGIFIRSRGAGVLSTPSYKGLGTQQTPILINGANMQSSMNGTMDLSIIDAAHFGGLSLCQADANSTGVQNMGDAI